MSFLWDTKLPISGDFISITCGIVCTKPPKTWDAVFAEPTIPLFTLKILLSLKLFNTSNFSVPIPMLLPADTVIGIRDK